MADAQPVHTVGRDVLGEGGGQPRFQRLDASQSDTCPQVPGAAGSFHELRGSARISQHRVEQRGRRSGCRGREDGPEPGLQPDHAVAVFHAKLPGELRLAEAAQRRLKVGNRGRAGEVVLGVDELDRDVQVRGTVSHFSVLVDDTIVSIMTPVTTDAALPRPVGLGRWGLVTLLLGQLVASLQVSIVSVAAPSIRQGLQSAGAGVQLVLSGYGLAYAVLLVTGARLGGDLGPRRLFVAGAAGFTVFSVTSGLAPNLGVLVAAQVAVGASAALMVPQVLSLIQVMLEGAARERAVGLYSMVLAAGVGLGQVLGGVLVTTDLAGLAWRPVFLVNVPVGLLLLLFAPVTLPAGGGRGSRGIDVPGVLGLAAAMVLFVVPLTFGPQLRWPGWTWLCLAAASIVAAGFVAIELDALRRGRWPLLDLTALRAPGVAPALLVVLATMASFGGILFTISQYLQGGLGFTPLAAGLTFLPYPAGFAAASLGWPRLAHGAQRWVPTAGLVALAAAAAALALRLEGGWSPALLPLLLVAGAGHAAAFSPLVARIAARLGGDRAPAFSALVTTTTQVAIVLGIAVLGSLYLAAAGAGPLASGHALALVCSAVAAISLLGVGGSLVVAARD